MSKLELGVDKPHGALFWFETFCEGRFEVRLGKEKITDSSI